MLLKIVCLSNSFGIPFKSNLLRFISLAKVAASIFIMSVFVIFISITLSNKYSLKNIDSIPFTRLFKLIIEADFKLIFKDFESVSGNTTSK